MSSAAAPALTAADLKASLTQPSAASDRLNLAFIQLCQISYDVHPSDIAPAVSDPAQVTPWGDGAWSCIWGPAVDWDLANLVYVAAYRDLASGRPLAVAVVVRGTDITGDCWSDLKQVFEDLAVTSQEKLPWLAGSEARVAEGTLDALTTIEKLRGHGTGLREFLAGYLNDPANDKPVLVVTGHSLGACVATVLAPWLSESLAAAGVSVPIVPVTFAGPTAGNAAFAAYYDGLFPYSPRYWNSLDVVPCGWAEIDRVKTIYAGQGLATPEIVRILIDGYDYFMREAKASYVQPGGAGIALQGTFCANLRDWFEQISAQHDPGAYIAMLQGAIPPCPSLTRPRNQAWHPDERAATLSLAQPAPVVAAT
jgi:hypothetical protein